MKSLVELLQEYDKLKRMPIGLYSNREAFDYHQSLVLKTWKELSQAIPTAKGLQECKPQKQTPT